MQKYKTLIIVKLRLNIITNKGVDWEIAYNTNRSEEHTSELQSHSDLVCRLLLEKKKKKKYYSIH